MNQQPHFTLKHALACLLLLPLTLLNLTAQTTAVPGTMNYQGTLLDAAGAPLPSGNYSLTFRLYSAEDGGVLLWGPQVFDGDTGAVGHTAQVPVVNGQFNVILGPEDTNDPTRNLAEAFFSSPTGFLEITIGDEAVTTPIAPRQEILSAPFAFQAENAQNAVDAQNAVPVGTIISLHPQAPAPNPNYWQLCDGTATIAGSRLADAGMTTTPVLTDDRFLMGGNNDEIVDDGGTNDMTLATENLPSHNHDMNHGHGINDPGHTHTQQQLYKWRSDNANDRDVLTPLQGGSETSYKPTTTKNETGITIKDSITKTGDTGNNSSFDNRPKYFKVIYYIKIN